MTVDTLCDQQDSGGCNWSLLAPTIIGMDVRTREQALIFLTTHWGTYYDFRAPEPPGGQWTAQARFGQHDQIQEWSAAELLEEVRDHYRIHRTEVV